MASGAAPAHAQPEVDQLERGGVVARGEDVVVQLEVAVREPVRVAAQHRAQHVPQHVGCLRRLSQG